MTVVAGELNITCSYPGSLGLARFGLGLERLGLRII